MVGRPGKRQGQRRSWSSSWTSSSRSRPQASCTAPIFSMSSRAGRRRRTLASHASLPLAMTALQSLPPVSPEPQTLAKDLRARPTGDGCSRSTRHLRSRMPCSSWSSVAPCERLPVGRHRMRPRRPRARGQRQSRCAPRQTQGPCLARTSISASLALDECAVGGLVRAAGAAGSSGYHGPSRAGIAILACGVCTVVIPQESVVNVTFLEHTVVHRGLSHCVWGGGMLPSPLLAAGLDVSTMSVRPLGPAPPALFNKLAAAAAQALAPLRSLLLPCPHLRPGCIACRALSLVPATGAATLGTLHVHRHELRLDVLVSSCLRNLLWSLVPPRCP